MNFSLWKWYASLTWVALLIANLLLQLLLADNYLDCKLFVEVAFSQTLHTTSCILAFVWIWIVWHYYYFVWNSCHVVLQRIAVYFHHALDVTNDIIKFLTGCTLVVAYSVWTHEWVKLILLKQWELRLQPIDIFKFILVTLNIFPLPNIEFKCMYSNST